MRTFEGGFMFFGKAHEKEPEPEPEENITYENVAIPEIHIHRKKK